MNEKSAGACFDRAKQMLDLKSDTDLSAYFDKPRTMVGNWRSRGIVPFKELSKLAEDKEVSLDWLLLGRGNPLAPTGKAEETPKESAKRYIAAKQLVSDNMTKQSLTLDHWQIEGLIDFTFDNRLNEKQVGRLLACFSSKNTEK